MWKINVNSDKCKYRIRPLLFVLFGSDKIRCSHPLNPAYNIWTYPPCNIKLCPIKLCPIKEGVSHE